MVDLGLMDDQIEALPSPTARVAGNVTVSGARGGVDCNPLLLENQGALLHGRLSRLSGRSATFADDLEHTIAEGLKFEQQVRTRIDEYVRANRLEVSEASPAGPPGQRVPTRTQVDLRREGISTILWANGFRPAFNWIELPIFDQLGFPRATRGVTHIPGLAFIGLPWLYQRRSPLLLGVGADAEHIARQIASLVTATAS